MILMMEDGGQRYQDVEGARSPLGLAEKLPDAAAILAGREEREKRERMCVLD